MKVDEYTAVPTEVRYRFGEFELDLNVYALTRAGRPLRMRRKTFDVLRFLIEHRGRVVTKEELLDAVWADSQVAEGAVPWTVLHARRVLGQSGADKKPIETVHGRGYRFVAEVEVLSSARASERPTARGLPSQAPAAESPFVGRQQAMALLLKQLAQARTGRGSLAALVGCRCVATARANGRHCARSLWRCARGSARATRRPM